MTNAPSIPDVLAKAGRIGNGCKCPDSEEVKVLAMQMEALTERLQDALRGLEVIDEEGLALLVPRGQRKLDRR